MAHFGPRTEEQKQKALEHKFSNRYGNNWREILKIYQEVKDLRKVKAGKSRPSVFSKTEFLRLLAGQIDRPDLPIRDFLPLAKMYADIRGWTAKGPDLKQQIQALTANEPPTLTEAELIRQFESITKEKEHES